MFEFQFVDSVINAIYTTLNIIHIKAKNICMTLKCHSTLLQ